MQIRIADGAILGAARRLVDEEGLRALTMRRLGDRLGVSATALYRHYRNKDEILEELVDAANEVLGGYLRRAASGPSPEGRLRGTAREYARFALEEPEFYRILFLTTGRPKMDILPEESRSANFQILIDRVRACSARAAADPALVAISLWAHWHGLVAMYRAGRFGADPEKFLALFERSADVFLRAITSGLSPGEGRR
ncbi:MAG TPA: TetR/AcrR family transcriptional regulator [Thermoanaerobaculia bacterium]|jgi:AcrR family transcriptional regulator|nr:TetR/AcrR family transcriptional regulator [Thermoanaerobaculia bacterium]